MAKEWAKIIKDADARELAEEAAEILLRQGFELPVLKYENIRKQGSFFPVASYDMESKELTVSSNKKIKERGGLKAIGKEYVEIGWNTQDNPILHEMGHHIHGLTDEKAFINKDQTLMNKKLISDEVSKYAATKRGEFEAELVSGILSGKSYGPKIMSDTFLRWSDDERVKIIYQAGTGEIPNTFGLPRKFDNMMETLHEQQGEVLNTDILKNGTIKEFIEQHAKVLDNAVDFTIRQRPMDDISVQRLKESNFVFSGYKTFHELNEAFPSLLDADGSRKPFERFLNDVQNVNEKYNRQYLKAEYNFAISSADMAAKWQTWWADEDRDRYLLQYRTVGDKRVRESHRLMHNITLPITSRFWDWYFPPNGWNCRCTVVRVRRGKYTESNEQEAMNLGSQSTAGKHQEMMRFNPGKQMACFPFYNPYTISQCTNCPNKPGTLKLAKVPDNELCAACKVIREMTRQKEILSIRRKEILKEAEHLKDATFVNDTFSKEITFSKKGIKEWLNQPFKYYAEKNEMLLDIAKIIKNSKYAGWTAYHKDNPMYVKSHIFETAVKDTKAWIIVREDVAGKMILHSISDSEKVLIGIKK